MTTTSSTPPVLLLLAWAFVGLPLAWGVWRTFHTALTLFR